MKPRLWPVIALGLALALALVLGERIGSPVPSTPRSLAESRDIDRRLDLAVNGSPSLAPPPPRASASPESQP